MTKKKKSPASELKQMDNFQHTVRELEKFQPRLDDTDNPMINVDLQACLGHMNVVIIHLCEQMSDIKQKAMIVIGEYDKRNEKKKPENSSRFYI